MAAASLDLILSAQAFHWFDPASTRAEFARILKRGRSVVLMWNERVETGEPFLEGYEAVLQKYGTDYDKVKRQTVTVAESLRAFFGANEYESKTFQNAQKLDWDGLKGRLLSSSYAPNVGHPNHAAMLHSLEALFRQHAAHGFVTIMYATNQLQL